jgi:release factor glutamine methyltransferase
VNDEPRPVDRPVDQLADQLADATARLATAGVPSPRHDAEELAAHLLGCTRGELVTQRAVDPEAYAALLRRRVAREPLQHLTGASYFRHLTLAVGPGVFLPRPETELVADSAIAAARQAAAAGGRAPVVVDLGAGSGAIAFSVAVEVPGAVVHAVELTAAAFQWLTRNRSVLPESVRTRVHLHQCDLATALPELDGAVDVVVSNPPYIPPGSVVRDPEVSEYDPPAALWGSGVDGLDDVRAVERAADRLLRPGAAVVVEHADLQGESAPAIFATTGRWRDVRDHRDLAGRPRFVTARRTPDLAGR